MTTEQLTYLKNCGDTYRNDLVSNIMPFWMTHGVDHKNGGIFTLLDRDGTCIDTTKSVWFQGRFAYVCALAYNNIEQRSEWLEASKSTLDFIERHCFDTDGHMFFSVTASGEPVRKRRYVFSECFATIALAEYAKASGDASYAQRALDMFFNIERMVTTPGILEPKSLVPTLGHSMVMMFINVANCVREVIDSPALTLRIENSLMQLRQYFMHPEFGALLETVDPRGGFIDTCEGRVINPGHCLETSWFIWEESARRGWDSSLNEMASTIADWAWDWGWDQQYGGIINFRDCRGLPAQDYSQDMKFWWPQTEAIVAMLYGYRATGDDMYLQRHQMIHEYAYKYFPDNEFGEWYGYMHRDGSVAQPAKGNLFKGPFHIPRMMIKGSMLCNEIIEKHRLNKIKLDENKDQSVL